MKDQGIMKQIIGLGIINTHRIAMLGEKALVIRLKAEQKRPFHDSIPELKELVDGPDESFKKRVLRTYNPATNSLEEKPETTDQNEKSSTSFTVEQEVENQKFPSLQGLLDCDDM